MDRIYYISFSIFRFIVRKTPDFIQQPILNSLAHLAYLIDKRHRKIAFTNLDFAFENSLSKEEKTKIVKRCYKNLVYNLADFVKNQGINKEELKQKVKVKNEHYVKEAEKSGKKIIFITAHYGNWELTGLYTGAFYGPITTVGRVLDSKVMNEILKKNREQFDIKIVDKMGAMKTLIKDIKSGRRLGLLVDQNTASNEGELIEFFGKEARHTPAAAIIARKFDALIIPVFITTNDFKKYTLTFYKPIETPKTQNAKEDILKSVQEQAKITEKVIREKPEEWFWFHRRWKNRYEHIYK